MNKVLSFLTLLLLASFTFLGCNNQSKTVAEDEASSEATTDSAESDFQISLAQWSLHKTFFGPAITQGWDYFRKTMEENPDALLQGSADPMDFPAMAAGYGINSIELVNTFYFTKASDMEYWAAFKKKCEENGVSVGLIMCDALGDLGDGDEAARQQAVENHYPWVEAAKYLGAHSIRVNAAGQGTAEQVAANAADGLSKLGAYAKERGINVIVENHGGFSSDGSWLSSVMEFVNMDNVGTLPDFGNFCIERSPDGCANEYDRYKGIAELMPFAKGVSAKSHEFDENGNEVRSDFDRIMKIVKDAGYTGYVGIEYEGSDLSEDEGIKATKALLEKVIAEL